MTISRTVPAILLLLLATLFTLMAEGTSEPAAVTTDPYAIEAPLPLDPAVVTGTLGNGITYYIRENPKPANRAVLRLALNAGSVLEDDDQKGLAHFVEHMAFNGTANFEKNELVGFMESIGMQFGPEVNAHTSFDETVYKLVVPLDDPETIETAFQILEDWAHRISFADEEIDKERGVIIEEWRLGRGAQARMRDKYFPEIFRNSRYADRLPIGNDIQLLRTFPYDTLRRYYRDWYRPELMAVVAIGDFDRQEIERLIREHFSAIPGSPEPRPRVEYRVPDHAETIYSVVTDPEAVYTTVEVQYKYDPPAEETVRDYRRLIVENLYNMMLTERLDELTQTANPPFLAAQSYNYRILRTKNIYDLIAAVNDGGAERGLETLLTEAMRVELHGFTEGELERAKLNLMSSVERAWAERDTTESVRFAEEYVTHFLDGVPAPGIEFEYELYRRYLPGVTLEELHELAKTRITEENRVVLVTAPEKNGVPVPTETELASVLGRVRAKSVEPYQDTAVDRPLIEELPSPGGITAERTIAELGVTEWTLSNGMKVVLKPTTFKNDEILFTAYSPGGTSLVDDGRFISAQATSSIVSLSGLGTFSLTELQRKLAGTSVSVSPYIGELTEGFSGSARPVDLETAFQLVHLYFTRPRIDATAFSSFMERMTGSLVNRQSQPEMLFVDTIQTVVSQGHFRGRPITVELLSEIEMRDAFQVYLERFANPADFTFIFTGAFTVDAIRPLVTAYLASLPGGSTRERWIDHGIDPPSGVVERTVRKGLEPKSLVGLVYSGPFEWSRENEYLLDSLSSLLGIRLRETVREEASGTYDVEVYAESSRYPDGEYEISIYFACDPERADELTAIVTDELERLRRTAPEASYLTRVKEIQRRAYEQNLKENRFWLNGLHDAYFNGWDPARLLTYTEMVSALTAENLRSAAETLLRPDRYVKVLLMPEAGAGPSGE
jgi:zinc protease